MQVAHKIIAKCTYKCNLHLLVVVKIGAEFIIKAVQNSMEVIEMQPEIDYVKIGQRIKAARLERGYSQAELGTLVGCSNNHMSHVEVGQTKVSLPMLLKLSLVLEKSFDYFILDTPYAKCESIINNEIADKLNQCSAATLVTVSKILDALIDQQKMLLAKD